MNRVEPALDLGAKRLQVEGGREPMVHGPTFRPVMY